MFYGRRPKKWGFPFLAASGPFTVLSAEGGVRPDVYVGFAKITTRTLAKARA